MTPHADFSDWEGKSADPQTERIVPRTVDAFRATLEPHLFDAEPQGLHWCLCPAIANAEALGRDGHPAKGGFLPPVPFENRMWAGGGLTLHGPLGVEDEVEKVSQIRSVVRKSGRSGEMYFVVVDNVYRVDGQIRVEERQDIVYLQDRPARSSPPVTDLEGWSYEGRVPIDAIALFRYSAMTFNGHRIHYDPDYARDVEGYGGLVIHGPLQATLLLNLAARTIGGRPRTFDFRGVFPAIGVQCLNLQTRRDEGELELRVLSADGVVTMVASAT